ncbi:MULTISPECIES: helix-turn-helix domain-containing protein [unclassified Streptomyces]|uniref:helix-turn-helix domain-containing protein n=1 Tax=unclassified Streptomyces TaxID=2593676 RepID=UPI000DAD84E9|nr:MULTISPECIES: helix-turn-helix transcriptional regulator [unclassified Streptomyces]PZT73637.1 XRE family transcriptional regulator [Streptomyces sp. AC1-42T]PZT83370.1 XRE family transcriptional regulator [Streptomyces sp. AC1-42W]
MTELTDSAPADARGVQAWRSFGVRLRHWRRRAGLTQAQVGARVGYDHTAISKLEHGSRRTPLPLARRLDHLLGAGGDLVTACEEAAAGERAEPAAPAPLPDPVRQGPLPGEPAGGALTAMLPPAAVLPRRLPAYGVLCPVHGRADCEVPELADAAALHARFCSLGPDTLARPALDTDTVHALTALLAVCLRADDEHAWPGATAVVERTLHAMLRWMDLPAAPYQRQLAPLAAEYAQSAGSLRLLWGRNGTAMAWLDRSLVWASMAGHTSAHVAALSDMSTLARQEGDDASAVAYGAAIRREAAGRLWAGALSDAAQARGHAVRGDSGRALHHIGLARSQVERAGDRDEAEAPWLSVASLRLRTESVVAGALRDLAAVTGQRRFAFRALDAIGTATRLLPPGMRSARMLFLARTADAYACAGEPVAASAVAGHLLDSTEVHPSSVLGKELRGLHGRLAAPGADRPEIDDFVRRLAAAVR